MTNETETFWKWGSREVAVVAGTIAFLVGVYFMVFQPIQDMQTQIAVANNKLDTLIAEVKQNEAGTQAIKDNLNLTFADIYQKLGSKYITK